jgi:hypothetical protein
MLQWIKDRTRRRRCTVQLARFDFLDFAPPAPVRSQGPHTELCPRRAERRSSLTSVHAMPSPGGQAARRRPRSSVRGRMPKPPRGPPALQVARPARGRQSKGFLLAAPASRTEEASFLLAASAEQNVERDASASADW